MAKMIKLYGTKEKMTAKLGNKILGTIEKKDDRFVATKKGSEFPIGDFDSMKDAAQILAKVNRPKPRSDAANQKLMPILNDMDLLERLMYLKDRWSDEKEFEDWADYENAIIKAFENCGVTPSKTFKRPFGAQIEIKNTQIKVFIKNKGSNRCCLSAKNV